VICLISDRKKGDKMLVLLQLVGRDVRTFKAALFATSHPDVAMATHSKGLDLRNYSIDSQHFIWRGGDATVVGLIIC
jgi:hypothetical protein